MEENKTLENKVFEALGEATMCWSETPKGVFDSTKAKEIGSRLMKDIQESHRNTIFDTLESVGRQQFMENIQEKENYEVVSGRFTTKGVSIIEDDKPSLEEAIEVLCNALREDKSEGSYYYSWQANIAMCMYDSFDGSEIDLIGDKNLLDICNKGAKTFLNLLIKQ